ncbi:hypothetical protein GTP58_08200 [Duganella sp. CY15W]|uniref:hypothetical protein n=1 Tax=Duganella sp. CY15W TaxID=2692172 RepID=UPI00136897DB|nr:hypothetical protein [Duganella sp. CY15W]MYM28303.1 hypothetical protein [Duganella sp. CY15W]
MKEAVSNILSSVGSTAPVVPIGATSLSSLPYIYVIDQNGNLLVCCGVANNQQQGTWFNLGIPEGTPLQTALGIANDGVQNAYVFSVDETGCVWCNQNTGITAAWNYGTWTPLLCPSPPSGPVQLTALGTSFFNDSAYVFCMGDDGNVWYTSTGMTTGDWYTLGPISSSANIQSCLGVTVNTQENAIQVTVNGSDNNVYQCNVPPSGPVTWSSADCASTISKYIGAVWFPSGYFYTAGLDLNGNLQCICWVGVWSSLNAGQPLTGPCATPVGVAIDAAGNVSAYVTDNHGVLYSCNLSNNATWVSLGTPTTVSTVEGAVGTTVANSIDYIYAIDQSNQIWGCAPSLSQPWTPMN